MKKLVLILSIIAMMLGTMATAFAKPSIQVNGVVSVDKAYGSNGSEIELVIDKLTKEEQKLADNILKPDKLKELLGASYSKNLQVIDTMSIYVLDKKNGKLDYTKESGIFPVTVTFNVPGVKAGSKVQVLHYYDGKWHVAEGLEISDGKVTGTFDKLSPFIFLVDRNTVSSVSQSITSPKTGGTDTIMYATLLAIVSFASVIICKKKLA